MLGSGPTPVFVIGIILGTVYFSIMGFKNPTLLERYLFSTRSVLQNKEYLRLVSSAFLHGGLMHLFFNMFTLYSFGTAIEYRKGGVIFLVIYFASVVGGGLLSLFLHRKDPNYRALGASGGVCGILYSCIFLIPGQSLYMFFIPIPIPAWLFAIAFIGYSCYGMKSQRDNIGHDAHLGGAIVGLLVTTLLYPQIVPMNPVLYPTVFILTICFFVYLLTPSLSFSTLKQQVGGAQKEQPFERRYQNMEHAGRKQVDRILDKISQTGMDSLTQEERDVLDRYSK